MTRQRGTPPPRHHRTTGGVRWLVLGVAFLALGCAGATGGAPEPESARDRLERGLAALYRDDYRGGIQDLAWVYERCYPRTAGQEALLVMAAVEMDPRNPYRRLDVGSELAARFLEQPAAWPWARPVAEALYLVGTELEGSEAATAEEGAPARSEAEPLPPAPTFAAGASDCGPLPPERERVASATPALPVPPVADYLDRVRRDQRALISRADSLESRLQALQAELAAKEQELERIRKTLKP